MAKLCKICAGTHSNADKVEGCMRAFRSHVDDLDRTISAMHKLIYELPMAINGAIDHVREIAHDAVRSRRR